MNLGQLNDENEEFIKNYKSFGYRTKTQLANDAIKLLRQKKAKESREKWRAEAFSEMSHVKPDLVFEDIDGEDFTDKKR